MENPAANALPRSVSVPGWSFAVSVCDGTARANISISLALMGFTMMLALGSSALQTDGAGGSIPLFVCAALFLTLALLGWLQRGLEKQISRFDAENDQLEATRQNLDAENLELKAHVSELKAHVANLNKLHNESVRMIRQLAIYGDECKTFGRDLAAITHKLNETDDSLGLTADELRTQVEMLAAVAATLGKTAVATVH